MSALQASPFLERLLRFLIPYFTGVTPDLNVARTEARETLASYGARTRAELLCAVQIIVFSFAALDTLGQANTPEMSPSMRIRFRGCANNLNRNCQKIEVILAKRLACDVPEDTNTQVEPISDLPDPQVEEILLQTQAKIDNHRSRLSANRPVHAPQPYRVPHNPQNRRTTGGALLDSLAAEMAKPVQTTPAISPTPGG